MQTIQDAEGHAEGLLRQLQMDGDDAPNPARIAKRLGVELLRAPRSSFVGRAFGQKARLGDRWIVRVRRGLSPRFERFVIAHELGHVIVDRDRPSAACEDEEQWCNVFAGALVLPRDPLRAAWRRSGELEELLERFPHVGPTCVALRLGELRLADVYVIERQRVAWARAERVPSREVLSLAATATRAGSAIRPGMRAVRLLDAPSRAAVALEPMEAEAG